MRSPDLDRLRLLASAFAGRPIDVGAADAGELAWTDGSTVFVDQSADRAQQIEMLAVQASLLAAGSFDAAVLRRLARRPALARRYLAIETHRALAANEGVLPRRLRRLADHERAAGLQDASASLARARGRQQVADAPATFGTIHARRLLTATTPVGRGAGDPGDEREVRRHDADRLVALDEDADADGDDVGHLLSSPVGGGGAVGRVLRNLLSPARARDGGGPPGADVPTHVATSRSGSGRRVETSAAPAAASALESMTDPVRARFVYPEWDANHRRYRPEWCTVVEIDPPVRGGGALRIPDAHAFRRPLARLGIGLSRCHRQRQGDDIDIDAVVEARVSALAGAPHDDDLHVASLRRRRDLAVLVLLDISGSANEPGAVGGIVHEHQRAAAAALTMALDELGDRVALYGFNSRGRKSVQLARVKAFDDRFDGGVQQRLISLQPGAYTRLGAAIRHATSILEERAGTPRRLLVVLSDGFAYDHGYESRYGEADARRSLAEARRRGVGCLCLSVGADTDPAALRRVFGTAAHAAVRSTDQLPRLIGPLFRSALSTAEAQRRVFQRKERTRARLEPAGENR